MESTPQRSARNPDPETPEKINDKLNEVLQEFRKTIDDLLGRLNNSKDDVELEESVVKATHQVVISMNKYDNRWTYKLRIKICQFMKERPPTLAILCKVSQLSVKNETTEISLRLLSQFTAFSNGICDKICNIPGYLQFLKKAVDENTFPSVVLSLVYNLVSCTDAYVSRLQELGFTSSLKHYLSKPNESNQLHALLIIAYIMKDDESYIIAANDSVVEHMISMFNNTIKSSSFVTRDTNDTVWIASVFSRGIGKLALNDGNKKLLVDKGCLSLLRNYHISIDNEDEQIATLKCIWTLAFDDGNQTRMMEDRKLMEFLVTLTTSESSIIRDVCSGILWTMRKNLAASVKVRALCESIIEGDPATINNTQLVKVSELPRKSKRQVMISYQWDHQIMAKQLRDKIQEQHNVWIDIDKMAGSISDAMAKAVQNSDIFLMCISRQYQNSPSCRAEAIYAAKLGNKIIPVMLQKDFKPDGWLGLTLSDLLYHSFTDQQMFDANITGLLTEIQQHFNSGDESETTTDTIDGQNISEENKTLPSSTGSPKHKPINMVDMEGRSNSSNRSSDYFPVKTWNSNKIQEWLTNYGVSGDNNYRLTGKQIAFLQKLRLCTPEYTHYHQTTEKYLTFKSLEEMANFEEAMDNLP